MNEDSNGSVKGKLGGVSQEAKLLEKAFKAAGVKVFKVKEYGSRGANYFVDVQAKGGKTTISIEVNQVSNVVFMHSQGRDLKLGELKENPRKLIKVLKVLKNQPGFGQSKLAKKESVKEMNFAKKAILKWNKLAVTGRKLPPKLLIRGRWYAWEEGDKKSVFVSDKYGKEYEFDYSDVEQMEESVNEAIKPQGYSQLNTMVKHATIYLRDLSKALRKQDDDAVLREVHFLAAQFTTMEKMLKDKKWNAKYNESITINGKKYKPLNENDQSWAKYYSWRNDKSMTPKQKIGMSMREVRDSLQELEKIVFRSIKLKKELKVGSDNYWKSTHSALRRIHERLVKLTGKIANLY